MNGQEGEKDVIEDRLLPHRITVRKPVQSTVPDSKRPVFSFQVVATGVRARFNPDRTSMEQTVLGQTPKKRYQLFMNVMDLLENYEIVNEASGESFVVKEIKNFFEHHMEAIIEEKR